MRTRFCYLALLLVPVLAFGPLLFQSYGTPDDFARLAGDADSAQTGILYGALLDIAFQPVHGVTELAFVRGLSVLFIVLTGVALWQLVERGGWGEWDALAVALAVVSLPSAQLAAGWATAWPAVLAALLSLAGFAAAESELEPTGTRRSVGLLGGVLLYFAAAMCYLPNAIMAIVPLAALTFSRPLRLADEASKWFRLHALLMVVGIGAAWLVERWMMSDAGIADRTGFGERLIALFSFSVPASWAAFLVGESGPMRIICAVIALAVLATVLVGARRQIIEDERARACWLLVLLGTFALFSLVVVLAPHWTAGYRSVWPLAGVVVVALAGAVRGIGDRTGKKPLWHYASLGGMAVLAVFAAAAQAHTYLAVPLGEEWQVLRGGVLRANLHQQTPHVVLVVKADAADEAVREPRFDALNASSRSAVQGMLQAALRERFPSGLPKGQTPTVEVISAAASAQLNPSPQTLVFDLTKRSD